MKRIVEKDNFLNLIDGLLKEYEVIAPVEVPNRGVFYQTIHRKDEIYLGETFPIEPIKKFFLAPSEWLFKQGDGEPEIEGIASFERKRIIIGARPCETKGLTLLDKLFNSEYKDAYYTNNRKRTTIIGLSCGIPGKSCFCTSMGISPVSTEGMDVLLFETGGRFIAQIITDKGKDILGSIGEELDEKQIKSFELEKERRKESIEKKIKVPESLDSVFEADYWDEVSKPCIGCGICTYLCPTCHCFDLLHEDRKGLRCWDGCSFPDFTLQASGENPRPTKRERYRQRVFHKFDYFKKNFGENLCVGCGRCIRYCPVKIDISEVVDKVPLSEKGQQI